MLDFIAHEEPGIRLFHKPSDASHTALVSVAHSKCVIDKCSGKPAQSGREIIAVRDVSGMKASVFQKEHLQCQ